MDVHIRTGGGRAVLRLEGDLTSASDLGTLRETVAHLLNTGVRDITLNLEAVSSIDSAALGQLVQLFSRVKQEGGDLKVSGLTSRAAAVNRLTQTLGWIRSDSIIDPNAAQARSSTWRRGHGKDILQRQAMLEPGYTGEVRYHPRGLPMLELAGSFFATPAEAPSLVAP